METLTGQFRDGARQRMTLMARPRTLTGTDAKKPGIDAAGSRYLRKNSRSMAMTA